MKYFTIISILLSVVSGLPRKFLDGHPQDEQNSFGRLNPAQASEHQQNDFQRSQFGTQQGAQYNQFTPQSNQYGQGFPQQPQYGPQNQYGQPPSYENQQYGGYNPYGQPPPQQKGKKGKKGQEPQMQPPMQSPYGQGFGQQQQQPQQTGQCASPCSQACAPSCSSQCCGANNAFTAMQPPPSQTQTACPGACPNTCAPVCAQKCCWDKRTTIPKPAAIPHSYYHQQYYY